METDHVNFIISKGGQRIGVLGRLRMNLTIDAANELLYVNL